MSQPEQVTSVGDFLDSLREDGCQSQGQFTLQVSHALNKLESYRLPDPGLFVLELLAFAVVSQAKYFRIDSKGGSCRIEFDGEPPNGQDLEDPLFYVLRSSGDSRMTHFALALVGAKQFCSEGHGVCFQSSNGLTLSLVEGDWKVTTSSQGSDFCSFELQRPFRLLGERLRRAPGLREIMTMGKLAPLLLTVDKGALYGSYWPPFYSNESAGRLVLKGDSKLCSLAPASGSCLEESIDEEFSAALYFGTPTLDGRRDLLVLRHGLCYRVQNQDLGPCVYGIIVSSKINRDLSGSGVVQDSVYRHIIEVLNERVAAYLNGLIQSDFRFRPATLSLAPAVERLQPSDAVTEWFEEVERSCDRGLGKSRVEELREALDRGDFEEAQTAALAELERFLKALKKMSYNVRRTWEFSSQQNWLGLLDFSNSRLDKTKEFVCLCAEQDKGKPEFESSLRPLNGVLLLRARGRLSEAQRLLEESASEEIISDQYRQEMALAEGRYEDVQADCLRLLGAESWDTIPEYRYGDPIFRLENLACALELQGNREALPGVYFQLKGSGYCRYTQHLRAEQWVQASRGILPFSEWLEHRVSASAKAALLYIVCRRERPSRVLNRALKGEFETDLVGPLRAFFEHTGHLYGQLFDFLVHGICQRMRLAGRGLEADQILARTQIWVETLRLRDLLLGTRVS